MKFLLINSGRGHVTILKAKNKLIPPHVPPLGLLYIGRSLEDEGHTVEVMEYYAEDDPVKQLIRSLPSVDAVGMSVTTYPYQQSAEIAHIIKKIDPTIPLMIGGPHCIFHPEHSLKDIPEADISVSGDGEKTIKHVAQALNGEKNLRDIPGVHFRHGSQIKSGKPYELITDLDTVPFPSRHLVDNYEYGKINDTFIFKRKLTSVITSRGCPFNCRFCPRTPYYRKFRQRSAQNVIEELQDLDGKYATVQIADDNFLTDTKRANIIMDSLIENPLNIDLIIQGTRVDTANRELYKKMKQARVVYMGFGIESGNQDVLDFYDKRITLEKIRNAVTLAHEMDFLTLGNFIIGAPIETDTHIQETINFACSLPLDMSIFNPLYYMYGSRLWDDAEKAHKIQSTDGYTVKADSRRNLSKYTAEELESICTKATLKFYLRPRHIMQQIIKALRVKRFNLIRAGIHGF